MDDESLRQLAAEAGLAAEWKDAFGRPKTVTVETLRHVLGALGLAAGTASEIEESSISLRAFNGRPGNGVPPLLTAEAGGRVALPAPAGRYMLTREDGSVIEGMSVADGAGSSIEAPHEIGYRRLSFVDPNLGLAHAETVLAVAPHRCFTVADALAAAGRPADPHTGPRAWGLAAQLYALRRPGDGGLGDARALAQLVRNAASHGADAVSISPVHAQFSADPDRFSPYAPSSRVMRNVLHAPIDLEGAEADALHAAELVDWPRAARLRLAALTAEYAATNAATSPDFVAWRARAGDSVELHARFEALHRSFHDEGRGVWSWREWPEAFRDCRSTAVAEFAAAHDDEIALNAWLQFRIATGLADAQAEARRAGMAIGIVSDLAVGADPGGSQCWSRPEETLPGLSIGAPPDLLARDGQNWGITAFSPQGLRRHGFRAFIEMLQAALSNAGGVRIDHAMGLNRLWIIPEGASSADGAYLSLPETDLLRLLRLESVRHKAIVLGEDLGTVPEGFADRLQESGINGMRVLWFERDDDAYRPPSRWTRAASAMTSTHDLPTVSGWWQGRDIAWNEALGRTTEGAADTRAVDRSALWRAFVDSGAASGPPPGDWDGYRVADAAASHVGRADCELVMLPLEDALAVVEAPNLPGTTDEHPNWQRRLAGDCATLLDEPHVAARLAGLARARRG